MDQVNTGSVDSPEAIFTESLLGPGDVGVRFDFYDPRVRAHYMRLPGASPLTVEDRFLAWDVSAWERYVSRFQYDGTNPEVLFSVDWNWPAVPTFVVDMQTLDSRRGFVHGIFSAIRRAPLPTHSPTRATARWIRAIVRWIVCHEGDELLRVDDRRCFHPHPGVPDEAPGEEVPEFFRLAQDQPFLEPTFDERRASGKLHLPSPAR